MGFLAFLLGHEPDEEYELDDDEDLDDGPEEGCPAFGCGCRRCALLAQLCVHEAGHVIAHLAVDVPFQYVHAAVDGSGGGGEGAVVVGDPSPIEADELWEQLVTTLAGAAAEEQEYGGAGGAEDDYEKADQLLALHPGEEVDVNDAAAEAAQVVAESAEALAVVAGALFDRGWLSYGDVTDLVG